MGKKWINKQESAQDYVHTLFGGSVKHNRYFYWPKD